jgi:hypothetical protein
LTKILLKKSELSAFILMAFEKEKTDDKRVLANRGAHKK